MAVVGEPYGAAILMLFDSIHARTLRASAGMLPPLAAVVPLAPASLQSAAQVSSSTNETTMGPAYEPSPVALSLSTLL